MELFSQTGAFALFIIALIFLFVLLLYVFIRMYSRKTYQYIIKNPPTPLDTDSFVGKQNPPDHAKVVILHRFNVGFRSPSSSSLPLTSVVSPHVDDLRLSRVLEDNAKPDAEDILFGTKTSGKVVVVGTIRMGFGHHRIAYSTASWALKDADQTYFHDFLALSSEEAELIKSTDELYSRFSRLASEIGGPVEKLWGSMMLGGDADALRSASLLAVHLRPLLSSLPKDTPFIATHQLVALTAVAAGFTNVINLVIDNHPQWFLLAPNALNLVQGPVNYQSFLKMGIPDSNLKLAGHWCPKDLVDNLKNDNRDRMQRIKDNDHIRILIPVGGAGAQRKFIIQLIEALASRVKQGKVQLFLNAGDHKHMKKAFHNVLTQQSLDYDTVENTQGVRDFQQKLLDGQEPKKKVTMFTFDEYFPAVATTDILCRVSDVLACKPSELAFYPIPKLMIRRVGDHEADSATRASELGDGTVEARTIEDALEFVNLFTENEGLLLQMCESIVKNGECGLYDGCKNAVKIALERAAQGTVKK